MDANLTEMVFIIDRSGSMSPLTRDTVGGFNSMINSQKKESGKANVTTVLFDDKYEILHNGIDIQAVPLITEENCHARGGTALLDAVGRTINTLGARLSTTPEEYKPSKVIMVIITDGEENSSVEFNAEQIKEMVEHQTEKYSWKFVFLGANIDSFSVGHSMGIATTSNYSATASGVSTAYGATSRGLSMLRDNKELEADWNKDIK